MGFNSGFKGLITIIIRKEIRIQKQINNIIINK